MGGGLWLITEIPEAQFWEAELIYEAQDTITNIRTAKAEELNTFFIIFGDTNGNIHLFKGHDNLYTPVIKFQAHSPSKEEFNN